ncbi:unnamed protein product [Chironomus riparius]|uniref:Acyltransferase 3 domain-containing protein n=1 Tax=Chironomus riparius TaxID=315576 RepID=A0A9N9RP82_9DIPT|nr:unnamed protein product [Chironomus riparius]
MSVCEYFLKSYQNLSSDDQWIQKSNSYDFGDFDSCISTRDNSSSIVGKHCLIKYHAENVIPVIPRLSPRNLKWKNIDVSFGGAVCVPNECGNDAIKAITDQLFNGTMLSLSTDYEQEEFCQIQKRISFTISDYFVIFFILLYLTSILIITWRTFVKKSSSKLLSSFSILENLKSLFENESSSLHYLKLIRAMLYIGLVFFHSVFIRANYPLANSEKMLDFQKSAFSKLVSTFPFGITGFFVISSALTTKKILHLLDKKSLNFFVMLIERYLRTIIVIAVLILLTIFINKLHIYQAPYYFPDQQSKECREYWWTTLLLIQNYYHPATTEMCLPQCWFLSANFQFFLLTPLVIYPIWKWKQSVFLIIPVLLGLAQAFILLFAIENEQHLKKLNFFAITDPHYAKFYLQSHYLASAWIVGMILGIIFHKCKEIKMNLHVKWSLYGFIIFMLFKLFAWNFVFGDLKFNIFLFTIDRLLVALFAGTVLFLSNYLRGDAKLTNLTSTMNIPINLLWIIVDRIGFSLYLVHPAVIIGTVVIRKQPLTLDLVPLFIDAVGDLFISIILAIALYLIVEMPFRKIIKELLSKRISYSNVCQQVLELRKI